MTHSSCAYTPIPVSPFQFHHVRSPAREETRQPSPGSSGMDLRTPTTIAAVYPHMSVKFSRLANFVYFGGLLRRTRHSIYFDFTQKAIVYVPKPSSFRSSSFLAAGKEKFSEVHTYDSKPHGTVYCIVKRSVCRSPCSEVNPAALQEVFLIGRRQQITLRANICAQSVFSDGDAFSMGTENYVDF